jgi:ComF family protein
MLKPLLNLLYPPRCLACKTLTTEQGSVCSACWNGINFITEPYCSACGHPLEYGGGEHTLCGQCLSHTPPYRKARSVFHYTDTSKAMIANLKYHDGTDTAPYLAQWLKRSGEALLAEADILVPVPLHPFRLFKRRYNQSALLANALAKQTGVQHIPDALLRVKNTPPQAELTRNQRLKNVVGAFIVNPKHSKTLEGKRVILIDDVMTTGATIAACTKALKKSKPRSVDVLTLGRTVAG